MKYKIKLWVLGWLFPDIAREMQSMQQELEELRYAVAELVTWTGGPGWKETIQNAVMQLDKRIDDVKGVTIKHQETLNLILDEIDPVEYTNLFGDKDIN